MASNNGWNKNVPSGTSSIAQGDDDIRSFKSFMQAWWEQEHYATDGSANSAGVHKPGSARAYVGPASALSNPETGRIFWITDEHDIAVAPSAGTWSKLGAARTGSVNTWTAQQNFSRDSALQYLQTGRVTGDSNERIILRADGAIFWGSGSTTEDTNLYRAGADHLKSDDTLQVANLVVDSVASMSGVSTSALTVNGVGFYAVSGSTTLTSKVTINPESYADFLISVPGLAPGDCLSVGLSSTGFVSESIIVSASVRTDVPETAAVVIYNSNASSAVILNPQTIKVIGFRL